MCGLQLDILRRDSYFVQPVHKIDGRGGIDGESPVRRINQYLTAFKQFRML